MSDDMLLGKLCAMVEANSECLEKIEGTQAAMREEIKSMRKELDMYAFAVKAIKFTASVALTLLVLKFGDIPKLWAGFIK